MDEILRKEQGLTRVNLCPEIPVESIGAEVADARALHLSGALLHIS
jgi:hypothetical protein